MAKMSRLDIERTNKFVDYLYQMAQYIDMEIAPHIEPVSLAYGRLMGLQGMIEGYIGILKGE